MYIRDGIAYAGEPVASLKVIDVRPLRDFVLETEFNDGSITRYDCKALLHGEAFAPLRDEAVFRGVVIEHGVTTWLDGEIDIAPEELHDHGVVIEPRMEA